MTLRPLSIILTASGCPGASTLIRMLKDNGEREVRIHALDARPDAIGRFLGDSFSLVPWGTSVDYIEALLQQVERRRPDILFVQSSLEVGPVSRRKDELERLGTRVLVGEPGGIDACNDKAAMHAALLDTPVRQPDLIVPTSLDEFVIGAHRLGYPERPVCFKPPVAKGSRGFRVLRADVDRVRHLLCERPSDVVMTLDEFVSLFRDAVEFPRLMLMEYVEGVEHTVDALVEDGRMLLQQTKTREAIDTGLAMAFRTVERPDLVAAAHHICRALQLDWFVNIQFKGDRLLEVNPRVSTFVYQEDFNLPYLGIKRALGELSDDALPGLQARVRSSRRTVRYYDQVFWDATAGSGTAASGVGGTRGAGDQSGADGR
ncbi:MAG: ATP-grasp domain-containing protein [Actinobacteria bacterium]|nr:ATP-grasp domain-containing protein [Actinomycetota bacterium]